MNIGEKLKTLRLENKLCQEELTKFLGVKQQTYQRYESGHLEAKLAFIVKLALFYNVSTDWLIGLTDEKTPLNRTVSCKWYADALNDKSRILADHANRPKRGCPKKST